MVQIRITKDPSILNVGSSRCPGWNLGNIPVRFDVDHQGLPVRSYPRSFCTGHVFLLPDWLIRSAATLAEEAIGSTPTPPLRLGVSFHWRSVSALFTRPDACAMVPTGADKWERGDSLRAKRFHTGPVQPRASTLLPLI